MTNLKRFLLHLYKIGLDLQSYEKKPPDTKKEKGRCSSIYQLGLQLISMKE